MVSLHQQFYPKHTTFVLVQKCLESQLSRTKLICIPENGVEVKDVQLRLRHKNIETTLGTYVHGTESMADKSVEVFETTVHKSVHGVQTVDKTTFFHN
jgi:hypothetical protein